MGRQRQGLLTHAGGIDGFGDGNGVGGQVHRWRDPPGKSD